MENEQLIIDKLAVLERGVEFIKEHIVDISLTPDDVCSLKEAEEDLKAGRTKRL